MGPERPCGHALLGQFDHAWALIEPDHMGTPDSQLVSVEPWPACGVQNHRAIDVAEQAETGGAIVVGVEQAGLRVIEVFVGEDIVLGMVSHGLGHHTIIGPGNPASVPLLSAWLSDARAMSV